MNQRTIEAKQIADFGRMLREEERSGGTIENYLRHVRMFSAWLENRCVSKELVAAWKERLLEKGYSPGTVNSMGVSLNRFLAFRGWADCRVKTLRIQRQLFREDRKELTRTEYDRLIAAAQKKGKVRLALLMETVCATGIRVSEVRYITVEALRRGWAEISLKGKIRTILIPDKLRRKLMKFAHKRKKDSGEIFLTRNNKSLSRKQIWAEMKAICMQAGVTASKVFPHNLRHLFARTFYKAYRDIVKLADVLGHSSLETTRIYLVSTGAEHSRALERLGLIV